MSSALIYLRVSTEEQVGEGHHSLSAQKSICSKLAADLGYEVVGVFEDAGRSASTMKRPALQELIERCQKDSTIAAVFVQDTDRLARNTQDHLAIRAILKKQNVKLISASQPTIDDTPEGQMIDTIVASVNQFQSDITARKTLKGMEEKARKGWLPGRAPVGYRNEKNERGELVIVVDEPMAELVREAFRLYATGAYSVAYLRDFLFEKGLRTRTGKKIQYSKMNLMLKNRFYLGELKWGSIRVDSAQHPPLIDQMTFERVQTVMDIHNHHANRRRKHDFLLRGFLYCSGCGSRITAEKHLRKRIAYYHCKSRGNCPAKKYVDTRDLESDVEQLFRNIQFRKSLTDRIVARARKKYEQKKRLLDSERLALCAKRTELDRKRDVLDHKLLDGLIDDDDFQRLRGSIRVEREEAQRRIEKIEQARDRSVDIVAGVLALSNNVFEAYRKAPPELQKHYLGLFWERFEVNGDTITRAVPSRIVRAVQAFVIKPQKKEQRNLFEQAHEPVLLERAPVLKGDYITTVAHPIQPILDPVGQLKAEWGG